MTRNGTLTGYDGDEAWNDCWTVQPMLALEDSWVSYEIGTEHTAPNYSSLGTGNRFRLLFGQSYPLERRTNQSAKYTHTLFITLQGTPKITEELAGAGRHARLAFGDISDVRRRSRPCAMRWRSIWTSPRPTAPFWRSPASPSRRTRSIPTLRP